ncbi:F-box protein: endocytic membrane traffic, recycling ReCYcling 1 [Microbotryomycetes sp. JL221]|nr:F-box protein: endocytic membrane traffic, recycling ReCYcling 1 [Microbotryomycetes sp. JL221]
MVDLRQERWTALLPDKRASTPTSHVKLHGKLPEEAYIVILQYLPVPDIPQIALTSRKLAALARDDRVWRNKLVWLNYKGPGAIAWRQEHTLTQASLNADVVTAQERKLDKQRNGIPSPEEPSYRDDDDEAIHDNDVAQDDKDDFGDFLDAQHEARKGGNDVDDGFGDFQDSADTSGGDDVFELADGFNTLSTQATATTTKAMPKSQTADDLMMLFDDDDNATTAKPPTKPAPKPKALTHRRKPSEPVAKIANGMPLVQVFKTHHAMLLPYYLSLIHHTTSSLVFSTAELTPMTRAQILSSLVRFCQPLVAPTRSLPQRMTVLRNVQSAMDFFESALLAEFERADTRRDEKAMKEKATVLWELNQTSNVIQVFVQKREIFYDQSHNPLRNISKIQTPDGGSSDSIDFSPMDNFMNAVLTVLRKDGSLLARTFPAEADVVIFLLERIANDIISEYITQLLSEAQSLQNPLFLLATAATFGQVYRLVDTVLEIEPKSPLVTKERAEDVIFKVFEPLMDDYLLEETEWIRQVLEGICDEWERKSASSLAMSDPTFLNASNPVQIKKNVLAGFTKALFLPVTIIPKTAAYSFNAITLGATTTFNSLASLGGLGGAATSSSSNMQSRSRTPISGISGDGGPIVAPPAESSAGAWGGDATPPVSMDPAISTSSATTTTTTKSDNFDRLQLLLSLDTALQLIQANRDSLKRVETFIRFPDNYGRKVRDTIEEVFIVLLQTLSDKHISPAFAKASVQMAAYRPEEHEDELRMAPLVQFFELVHVGDTIVQMLEVYFEKEMAIYIDKRDFLNTVVREKKRFESSLDDAVATGLNAGVNVLMNQVEHVVTTHQDLRDFSPPEGTVIELQPTRACNDVVQVLATHCNMLKGSTDKQILEVFNQEVGIRLFGIVLKHIKRQLITLDGGFQLIADLNSYHAFISSLKQPTVTAYFSSLKMVGEIFIVDSPKELGQLVRDVSRYEGVLSADDLYEIVQRRADWKVIEKQVEKQLFGLKLSDDCCIS